MDETHADEKRDNSEHNSLVLPEELLGSDEPTGNTQEDNGGTEESYPPTDEERWLVLISGVKRRRRRVQRHIVLGRLWPRPSASAEGTSGEFEVVSGSSQTREVFLRGLEGKVGYLPGHMVAGKTISVIAGQVVGENQQTCFPVGFSYTGLSI